MGQCSYHRDPPTKEVFIPNIDGLVKEGLELDQHYVFRIVSPSRSCLMSGRLPIHVNENIGPDNYKAWLPLITTPPTPHPPRGEDLIYPSGYFHHANDYYTEKAGGCKGAKDGIVDLWDTNKPASRMNGTGPDKHEEGLFREHLLKVAEDADASTPLFLYYAPHIVHTPFQVPDIST